MSRTCESDLAAGDMRFQLSSGRRLEDAASAAGRRAQRRGRYIGARRVPSWRESRARCLPRRRLLVQRGAPPCLDELRQRNTPKRSLMPCRGALMVGVKVAK
eukprot:scaffold603_cov404-Prasinococcus_capsulatus_cf.AAC.62